MGYGHYVSYRDRFSLALIVRLISIVTLLALAILNTELLIKQNTPTSDRAPQWSFGQVVIVPY